MRAESSRALTQAESSPESNYIGPGKVVQAALPKSGLKIFGPNGFPCLTYSNSIWAPEKVDR